MKQAFYEMLVTYQQRANLLIDQFVKKMVNQNGNVDALSQACGYALTNGGKRFRPVLVFMMAKALGDKFDVSEAALVVEFLHTASLIADDLPCMDNDDMRRDKPSTHKVYGESIALLASYALIAEGYGALGKIARSFPNPALGFLAIENVSKNSGLQGVTGGQYIDLNTDAYDLSLLKELIYKKTVTLFEVAFFLGWVFGGGSEDKIDLVKKAAYHFGFAFQIADDFDDREQDLHTSTAESRESGNLVQQLGVERALEMFHAEINAFELTIVELEIDPREFTVMARFLVDRVGESIHLR